MSEMKRTWSKGQEELSDREMKIRTKAVYISTVILRKIPLMPTFGKPLKTSKSLFPR